MKTGIGKIILLFVLSFIAQFNVFGQNTDENLPVPKIESADAAGAGAAAELRAAYDEMRRHLCIEADGADPNRQKEFGRLLNNLFIAQHKMVWALAGDFDSRTSGSMRVYFVKIDEIHALLTQAAQRNPANAAEIRRILDRSNENKAKINAGRTPANVGYGLYAVYSNAARLAALDLDLTRENLRKFGIRYLDYEGLRGAAFNSLRDTLLNVYARAYGRINERVPASAPRFAIYGSEELDYTKVLRAFQTYSPVSFDVQRLDGLLVEDWYGYGKADFDAARNSLKRNCRAEKVLILYVPSRRADAETAKRLLAENKFEADWREVEENAVPTHKGKIYFQNNGRVERANLIAGLVGNIEKLSPARGTAGGGSNAPDYSLWILGNNISDQNVNLSGEWTTLKYSSCTPAGVKEVIRITQTGTRVVAVKAVGNPCVKAGEVTFRGDFTQNPFRGELQTRNADGTNDQLVEIRIFVKNPNTIEIRRRSEVFILTRKIN